MNEVDVLITGAGPTGLTAATLLARYGVDFRIVDKAAAPAQTSKALGVQARTLELWDKLGLAEGAVARGQPLKALNLITKGTLPRGGKPFVALGRDGKDVSPYPYLLIHEQNKTERMLLDDLAEQTGPKGAYGVERNTEVGGLEQHPDHVTVTLRHDDGTEEVVKTRYLIAADGASSFVRKALALEFSGATYADPLFVADVEMNWSLDRDKLYAQLTRQGLLVFFPMRGEGYSDHQYRIVGRAPDAWEDKELAGRKLIGEDVQRLLDEHGIVAAKISSTGWVSKYRIHRRMTKQFRVGNIFLAGDSAHIHSPAGGQGMNTGIQDAWNIAWKLALVVRGHADETLLDSYESERIPVAKAILNGSDKGFTFVSSPNYFGHLLRSAILLRLGSVTSLKHVGRAVFKFISQTWIGYRKSPAVGGDKHVKRAQPGDRAPYAHFKTGESIFSRLQGVDHHLLLFVGEKDLEAEQVRAKAHLDNHSVAAQVHVIDASQTDLRKAYGVRADAAFLIRPDGHIAWRGAASLEDLTAYMNRFYTRRHKVGERGVAALPSQEVAV